MLKRLWDLFGPGRIGIFPRSCARQGHVAVIVPADRAEKITGNFISRFCIGKSHKNINSSIWMNVEYSRFPFVARDRPIGDLLIYRRHYGFISAG